MVYTYVYAYAICFNFCMQGISLFHLGYIGHMLPDNLEIAYMLHTFLFLLGYFLNFASGIILEVQGMQYLLMVCMTISLPLYLLAEWMHKSYKANNKEVKVYNICI